MLVSDRWNNQNNLKNDAAGHLRRAILFLIRGFPRGHGAGAKASSPPLPRQASATVRTRCGADDRPRTPLADDFNEFFTQNHGRLLRELGIHYTPGTPPTPKVVAQAFDAVQKMFDCLLRGRASGSECLDAWQKQRSSTGTNAHQTRVTLPTAR